MEHIKEISTKIADIRFEEANIVSLTWKEDAVVDVPACEEIVRIRKEHQTAEKALLLVDQRKFWNITKEAKEYSEREDVQAQNKAIALLTGDSFASILVANAYIKLYRPNVPVKMFRTEDKARSWLLKQ